MQRINASHIEMCCNDWDCSDFCTQSPREMSFILTQKTKVDLRTSLEITPSKKERKKKEKNLDIISSTFE